jgi:hypothetical protein
LVTAGAYPTPRDEFGGSPTSGEVMEPPVRHVAAQITLASRTVLVAVFAPLARRLRDANR